MYHLFQLGLEELPEQVEPAQLEDEDFLRRFHHLLLEVQSASFSFRCTASQDLGKRSQAACFLNALSIRFDEIDDSRM